MTHLTFSKELPPNLFTKYNNLECKRLMSILNCFENQLKR